MPYFHVRITTRSGNQRPEVELDLSPDELESRFLEPYRFGRPIVVSGKSVNTSDIERIKIYETPGDSNTVNTEILARGRSRNVITAVDTRGRLDPEILSRHGVDVTKNYIEGPPGHATIPQGEPTKTLPQGEPTKTLRTVRDARKVFVIHGRNYTAREAMFAFLRAIGLHPLEWNEVVQMTGKASPYIGEILDTAFSEALAVVALFTPDDEARLREPFRKDDDYSYETELTGQARPNVLFEAGMAMGRNQNRTILVELGNLRPFSDVAGRHTIRLNNSSQSRQDLAHRLQNAGCLVNLTGTDWHTVGDFESALSMTISIASEITNADEQATSAAKDSGLSEDAKALLKEATIDSSGEILKITTLGGLCFRTNHRYFGEMGDRRSEAKWEGAIRDLLELGLLTEDTRDELFKVTREGFAAIDYLERPQSDRRSEL